MTRDHYATLGIAPSADEVVIHAAYRALMRRYHPDLNPRENTDEKVREISEAYAALRNPEKRAEYDRTRSVRDPVQAFQIDQAQQFPQQLRQPPVARTASLAAIGIAALAVLLVWNNPRPTPAQAAPDQSIVEDMRPAETGHAELEPISVPQPAAIHEAAPSVRSIVEGDPMLAEVAELPPMPAPKAELARAAPVVPPTRATQPAAASRKPTAPRQGPSTACAGAQCPSDRIAALESHQLLLFNQSLGIADPVRRGQLNSARDSLVARRGACRSDACVADAYLSHFREVSAIMERGGAGRQP